MKNISSLPDEVLELIRLILPHQAAVLEKDSSLKSIMELTQAWALSPEARLNVVEDPYLPFQHEVLKAARALGLRETKRPRFSEYEAVVIFGSTALSYFKIFQDLLHFYENDQLRFSKIYLLGGDRPVHQSYDSLNVALKHHPDAFKRVINNEEIFKCKNEMEVMELVTEGIKLPYEFKQIPIVSVFTPKNEASQSSTADTILQLLKEHHFSNERPLLFMGTFPYIVRQGLEAQKLMPHHIVDTASIFGPYLETMDTPWKGELPPILALDELRCLFYNMEKLELKNKINS